MKKRSVGSLVFDGFNTVILLLIITVTLYPVLHVLFASVSDSGLLMQHRGLLLKPVGFNLEAYKTVMQDERIYAGYRNILFVLVVGVFVNILMTCIGAYFLSRKNVLFVKPVMILITTTMFITGGLIPFYLVVKGLGLQDSLFSLILPVAINTYNLIILRTAFMAVPDSLVEAAKIDGAADELILFRIIIPLTMPTIAVLLLYYSVQHWNAWFYAMIFIRKPDLYPLQLILREILIQNQTNQSAALMQDMQAVSESIKYATIMVSIVPVLCIYPFLQKYFTKGVMVGAVKG